MNREELARKIALSVLSNCACKYAHPEDYCASDPQSVIDKQVENAASIILPLLPEESSCCGDAHLELKSAFLMLADLGFVREEEVKDGMREVRWRNKRAEEAEEKLADSGWVACAERLPETRDDVELAWGDEPANMPPAIGYFEKIGEQAGHWWGADGDEISQYENAPKFWRPRRPIGTLPPAPAKEGE